MKELKEIRVGNDRLALKENLVKTDILPKVIAEMDRDVIIQGDVIIEGAIFARNFEIEQGPFEAMGALFTQGELYVQSGARGWLTFNKSVASANSVVSLGEGVKLLFGADLNAKVIKLRNAFISANVFAEEIMLENCIVIGGVFASSSLTLVNCIVGTFNAPSVSISKINHLLLPSAFSVEPISALPGASMINLSLADLGSLYKGLPEKTGTGKIQLDINNDKQRTVLVDGEKNQHLVNSYSVAGKVLAADLIDFEKLENHFLLTAASLGSQLLKAYDLGENVKGERATLSQKQIAEFFFAIMHGKIVIKELDDVFDLDEIKRTYR